MSGIGPGAHGGSRSIAANSRRASIERRKRGWRPVERDGHATRQRDEVAAGERLNEMTMMGLRLAEGIPYGTLHRGSGLPFDQALMRRSLDG